MSPFCLLSGGRVDSPTAAMGRGDRDREGGSDRGGSVDVSEVERGGEGGSDDELGEGEVVSDPATFEVGNLRNIGNSRPVLAAAGGGMGVETS